MTLNDNYQGRRLVLLSGGIDSSTLLTWQATSGNHPEALFVDHGQPSAANEFRAARNIARRAGVGLAKYVVRGPTVLGGQEIPGRNALLATLGLWHLSPSVGVVFIGIHARTPYPDCSAAFVDSQQALFDVYARGTIVFSAPFVDWSKGDISTFAHQLGLSLADTYSCELGLKQPCGACASCADLEQLRAGS